MENYETTSITETHIYHMEMFKKKQVSNHDVQYYAIFLKRTWLYAFENIWDNIHHSIMIHSCMKQIFTEGTYTHIPSVYVSFQMCPPNLSLKKKDHATMLSNRNIKQLTYVIFKFSNSCIKKCSSSFKCLPKTSVYETEERRVSSLRPDGTSASVGSNHLPAICSLEACGPHNPKGPCSESIVQRHSKERKVF